jgi:hypothetical protein
VIFGICALFLFAPPSNHGLTYSLALQQTGSGKTHTMLGDIDHLGDKPSDNRGMTPRVFEYLFSRIHLVYIISCSVL